jgi:hypothetical protein
VEMAADVVPSPAQNISLALLLFKYTKTAYTTSHELGCYKDTHEVEQKNSSI